MFNVPHVVYDTYPCLRHVSNIFISHFWTLDQKTSASLYICLIGLLTERVPEESSLEVFPHPLTTSLVPCRHHQGSFGQASKHAVGTLPHLLRLVTDRYLFMSLIWTSWKHQSPQPKVACLQKALKGLLREHFSGLSTGKKREATICQVLVASSCGCNLVSSLLNTTLPKLEVIEPCLSRYY